MGAVERLEINRDVLVRMIKALMNQEDLKIVAEIVSMDPALSTRLLKFINSAFFPTRKPIESLEHAIVLLGYGRLKELAFSLLTGAVLHNKTEEEIKEILEYAYLMKILEEKLHNRPGDKAFLVGLLHFVKNKLDGELYRILENAGVSKDIMEGLYNPESELGKLLDIVDKFAPMCRDFLKGELNSIPIHDKRRKQLLTESCLEAEQIASQVLELIR